jgi:hypothetical protein
MKSYLQLIIICFFGALFIAESRGYELRDDISYVNDNIPTVKVPGIKGEFYNDLIPDTLDIADRAQLAIHCMTSNPDPNADYETYERTYLLHNPPVMWHDWDNWFCSEWKFYEAISLLRLATGSDYNRHVDEIWLNVLFRSLGDDGLLYMPMEGRPWNRINTSWGPTVWRADGTTTGIGDKSVIHVAHPLQIGRAMGVLTNYSQIDKNPIWKKTVEKMIDRCLELMVDKGDYGYLPLGFYEPNAKIVKETEDPIGLIGIESYGRLIQAPANYYKFTGYEPAKTLARKLINCVIDHSKTFDSEGRFLNDGSEIEQGRGGPHFHCRTFMLMSILDYVVATGDNPGYTDFVRKSYEWAREQGNPTVGFFPEWLSPDEKFSETCEVADMVALSIKLSQAGAGDYWEDAEKWIRNQYSENQLTRIDCIYAAAGRLEQTPVTLAMIMWDGDYKTIPPGTLSYDRVLERNMGGFAGWPSPNDWLNDGKEAARGFMHCCTGNASRTLYYIWENMVDFKEGVLKVNLLLNRASRWADVYSYLPYEGQVRVTIKQPCTDVLIRMPNWVEREDSKVVCLVDNKPSRFKWQGRYIDVGACKPGQRIQVTFPIETRTVKETIAGREYTLVIRGNTVCSIDPPGKYCPLYQRQYYLENNMPWRPATRFMSECMIDY